MHDAMPQLEAPFHGAFYDHEADADLRLPRRRVIADWGADELFHHTPRRRRSTAAGTGRERRFSGPASGAATVTRIQEAPSYVPDARVEEVDADRALREVESRHPVYEIADPGPAPGAAEERGPHEGDRPAADDPAAATARRTVQIKGHPEATFQPRARRRTPPTVEERLGHRPDRVAAWAVALGMLLIILAVLSA